MASTVSNVFGGGNVEGYFSEENISSIQNQIQKILQKEFNNPPVFERSGIIMSMKRVIESRRESIENMNRRVIMECTNSFRNYQIERNKHFQWEEDFIASQKLYNTIANMGPDLRGNKVLMNSNGRGLNSYNSKYYRGNGIQFHFL